MEEKASSSKSPKDTKSPGKKRRKLINKIVPIVIKEELQPTSSKSLKDTNSLGRKRQKRTYFSTSEKDMVLNVYNYVKESHSADKTQSKTGLHAKTAAILGIGVASVYRILKEYATEKCVKPPITTKKRPIFSEKIDEYQKCIIRQKVYNFFLNGELPTLKKVLQVVNDEQELPNFKRSTFQKILKHLNFQFLKQRKNNSLIDREDILIWRMNYLSKMQQFRRMYRPIFYMGETCVYTGKSVMKANGDSTQPSKEESSEKKKRKGTKKPTSKESRLVLAHVGNEHGFVEGAEEIFEFKPMEDSQELMDTNHFEQWFENVLSKLGGNVVIVMDNVSYHSRREENIPTSTWKKANIQDWLRNKKIIFDGKNEKTELLKKVNEVKTNYVVDELARKYNVEVMRLPPYHSDLNPIKLIWSDVKEYVTKNNTTFEVEDVKVLLYKGIQSVSAERWQNCVGHIINLEENFYSIIDAMSVRLQEVGEKPTNPVPPPNTLCFGAN